MNLDQLKTFAALAESGSLRSAADRLGLSPSSAAERVSLLEHELGLRLLDRGARGCTLTRSGAQYLKDAYDAEPERWNNCPDMMDCDPWEPPAEPDTANE